MLGFMVFTIKLIAEVFSWLVSLIQPLQGCRGMPVLIPRGMPHGYSC